MMIIALSTVCCLVIILTESKSNFNVLPIDDKNLIQSFLPIQSQFILSQTNKEFKTAFDGRHNKQDIEYLLKIAKYPKRQQQNDVIHQEFKMKCREYFWNLNELFHLKLPQLFQQVHKNPLLTYSDINPHQLLQSLPGDIGDDVKLLHFASQSIIESIVSKDKFSIDISRTLYLVIYNYCKNKYQLLPEMYEIYHLDQDTNKQQLEYLRHLHGNYGIIFWHPLYLEKTMYCGDFETCFLTFCELIKNFKFRSKIETIDININLEFQSQFLSKLLKDCNNHLDSYLDWFDLFTVIDGVFRYLTEKQNYEMLKKLLIGLKNNDGLLLLRRLIYSATTRRSMQLLHLTKALVGVIIVDDQQRNDKINILSDYLWICLIGQIEAGVLPNSKQAEIAVMNVIRNWDYDGSHRFNQEIDTFKRYWFGIGLEPIIEDLHDGNNGLDLRIDDQMKNTTLIDYLPYLVVVLIGFVVFLILWKSFVGRKK